MTANPTILVVEDEALIRLSVADSLRHLGWDVREAGNAAQALEVIEACDEISLVFTDIDMPGPMTGLGLASTVSKRWPKVEIVITSGFEPSIDDLPYGSSFVPKPYVPELLARDFCKRLGPESRP